MQGDADRGMRAELEDLAPTPLSARSWNAITFSACWIALLLNPASLSVAASLLSLGLTFVEACVAHTIAGLVLLLALILNAWPGVKYGIPYPVLCRASFGFHGAHFCTLTRGFVAIFWLSFQLWQASLVIAAGINRFAPGFERWTPLGDDLSLSILLIFLAFTGVHVLAAMAGVALLKPLVNVSAVLLVAGWIGLCVWAGSLAPFSEAVGVRHPSSDALDSKAQQWLHAINSSISTWSTLVLNVVDLSRFCKTQREQVVGQVLGFPTTYALTGFIGVWIASATLVRDGEALWLVGDYIDDWELWAVILGMIAVAVSALVTDIVSNMLSPINDLLNLQPVLPTAVGRWLTYRSCAMITLGLAVAMCPWWAFASQAVLVKILLEGYATVTGSITGVMLTDFWLLRRAQLDVGALYIPPTTCCPASIARHDANQGTPGANWKAFVAVGIPIALCAPGFFANVFNANPSTLAGRFFMYIYSSSWLFTVFTAGALYFLLNCGPRGAVTESSGSSEKKLEIKEVDHYP